MRLLPVEIMLPCQPLLRALRRMRGMPERQRLPHALMAHGASELAHRMRRGAAHIRLDIRMGTERLGVLFVALAVNRQMAGGAAVHLRDADEVHVIDDFRRDDLAHRDGRRHEVKQRRVENQVVDQARLEICNLLVQAGRVGRQLPNLPIDLGHAAREHPDLGTDAVTLRRQPLDLQAEVEPVLEHFVDLWPGLRGLFRMLFLQLFEFVALGVVDRLGRLVLLVRQKQRGFDAFELVLQRIDLILPGGPFLFRLRTLRLQLRHQGLVDLRLGRRQTCPGHLELQPDEAPLVVLPLAVVVVPDHQDRRDEQKDAGRREDDVQKIDVVRVSDGPLVSHFRYARLTFDKRSGLWLRRAAASPPHVTPAPLQRQFTTGS